MFRDCSFTELLISAGFAAGTGLLTGFTGGAAGAAFGPAERFAPCCRLLFCRDVGVMIFPVL